MISFYICVGVMIIYTIYQNYKTYYYYKKNRK